ncbi:hypothetical protein [uncultured Kingella sp.]|uniref:hypothetical protein n=1 Tax=uncultured Kingella sp. TaxID=159270 RepID=UPI002594C129|nr:hypothetical protein [uncultured Kingella sp.]
MINLSTPEQARRLLRIHAFADNGCTAENSLLHSLRPFSGSLKTQHFHETIAAVRVLAAEFGEPHCRHETVRLFYSIIYFARAWGLSPQGMLQRNGLLNPEQTATLSSWWKLWKKRCITFWKTV